MEKQGGISQKDIDARKRTDEMIRILSVHNTTYGPRAKKIDAAATLAMLEGLDSSTGTAGLKSAGDLPVIATHSKKLFYDEKGPYVVVCQHLGSFA